MRLFGKAPEFELQEAKATAVNGYIKGQIKNNTGKDIEKTNIKIDLYNKRGNNIATRYQKLENFKSNQTIEFNLNFRASNVSHFVLSFTDENIDAELAKEAEEFRGEANRWLPFIGLATLFCFI